MLQAQMTNSLFVDSKQWKKCKVIKVKKKNVQNETVGWIYFFFISENMHVDVCMCVVK